MDEIKVRQLEIEDLPALFRLIPALWIDQGNPPTNDIWIGEATEFIKKRLGTTMTGFVAEHPEQPKELISIGLAVITDQIPTFWNTSGKVGYCQWFYTAPEFRRQKIGYRITQKIVAWFQENEVVRIQLHATKNAVKFYEQFGFEESTEWPNLVWRKPGTAWKPSKR